MLKVVVACGSGVATSETVVANLKTFLEDHHAIGIDVQATDFKQLSGVLSNYDIYVWLARPTPEIQEICQSKGIPDVNGVDILTGAKGEKTYLPFVNALMQLKTAQQESSFS